MNGYKNAYNYKKRFTSKRYFKRGENKYFNYMENANADGYFNDISYTGTHTNPEHMKKFYSTFEKLKNQKFDGLIITGAPVEQIAFEEVIYWEELTKSIEWSNTLCIY